MSRGIPRRPASSRTPTSRPRRVAGQTGPAPAPGETEAWLPEQEGSSGAAVLDRAPGRTEPDVVEPDGLDSEAADLEDTDADLASDLDPDLDEAPQPRRGMAALFDSRRVTVVLVALILVLGVLAGGLAVLDAVGGSDEAEIKPPPKGEIAVPDGRPVLIGGADATNAAADAATAATTLFTRTAADYDQQVEAATELMTADYAAEFRQTTDEVKAAFVADKTSVEVRIVAQGVVRANRSQVQVLLFLNQYVSKDGGETTYTPYRALVTMVHTEGGWLVSDLDTK